MMEKRIPNFDMRVLQDIQSKQLIRTGDVVIIHEDNKPRPQWRIVVVEDLIEGKDGKVCAAHIRTSNHKTT